MNRLGLMSLASLGVLFVFLAARGLARDAGVQFEKPQPRGPASCPAGWTLNPLRGECYRCPDGYRGTMVPLDGIACERSATIDFKPAHKFRLGTGLFGLNCPAGQFRDWDGYCYKCPDGYVRTPTGIRDPGACARIGLPAFADARWTPACPSGAFRDLGRGDCYSCRKGWFRTAAPVDSETGCADSPAGMLGVNPRGLCTDLLTAIDRGGAALERVQTTIETFISPVMKPVHDGVRKLAEQVRTPAGFDQLLEQIRPHMRPYRDAFETVASFSERVWKAREGLDRLMSDPAILCDGDAARVNRELGALGLLPNAPREAGRLDTLGLNLARRPQFGVDDAGDGQSESSLFVVAARQGVVPLGGIFRFIYSVGVVTNGARAGAFFSGGLAVAAREPGLDFERTYSFLVFPSAGIDDFSGVGALSAEISLGAGDRATDFFGRLRRMSLESGRPLPRTTMAGKLGVRVPRLVLREPQPPLAPLVIPLGVSWSFDLDPPKWARGGPFVWGLGPTWTVKRTTPSAPKVEPATPAPAMRWFSPGASFDFTTLLWVR